MGIQDIYQQGEAAIRNHDYGRLLDYVESGFVRDNDRRLLDRFSFRQRCVDAPEADPAARSSVSSCPLRSSCRQ